MMSDVNWWLMALAFAVGLVLTLALMIRRVKREVPVYAALGRGPGVGGAAAGAAAPAAAPAVDDEPYGRGSIRVAATADGPTGYTVKGNEDSMLYHTAESPSYKQTIAEIWFRDTDSAERAGFSRWDTAGATGAVAAATLAATSAVKTPAASELEVEPYGPGSVRVAKTADAPSGYTVKGNEDSMLYHSIESPSYKQTIAEIWFSDVESAERAGFARWDSGKSQRGRN